MFFYLNNRQSDDKLISPWVGLGKLSNNLWIPKKAAASLGAPQISASGAYFVDVNTGEVLYQKNEHQRLPVASLAKIMTVVVALENRDWNDSFLVSSRAAQMEPDKMLLRADERLTLEELLDGIFLVSANDAAEALAEGVFGDRDKFIVQMDQKAKQLGMMDSLFINPSGLEEDNPSTSSGQAAQYSSAYDVALMSRYAIKTFPHLLDISSKEHIYLPETSDHQDYDLWSGINLLTTYKGVVGFKTGFTPEAGLTLVTVCKREGHTILGVLLGSGDRRGEAKELLDYSFKKLGVKV